MSDYINALQVIIDDVTEGKSNQEYIDMLQEMQEELSIRIEAIQEDIERESEDNDK